MLLLHKFSPLVITLLYSNNQLKKQCMERKHNDDLPFIDWFPLHSHLLQSHPPSHRRFYTGASISLSPSCYRIPIGTVPFSPCCLLYKVIIKVINKSDMQFTWNEGRLWMVWGMSNAREGAARGARSHEEELSKRALFSGIRGGDWWQWRDLTEKGHEERKRNDLRLEFHPLLRSTHLTTFTDKK